MKKPPKMPGFASVCLDGAASLTLCTSVHSVRAGPGGRGRIPGPPTVPPPGGRAGQDVGGDPNTMYFQYIVLGPGRGGGAGFRGRLHRFFCHCIHSRGDGLCSTYY